MNMKHRRVAALAIALTAVSALTACGGSSGDEAGPSAEAHGKLDAPSGPGAFVATAGDPGKAYIAQMRDDQKSGRSTNAGLAALTDEQLLSIGRNTCTAKEQGATNDQIQQAIADGMTGVSASDTAPYVQGAITTLCKKA